jgi:2-amino-4-hydroxy-6-hydroxymethyldihydropteridine diphosphokinase
MTAVYLALGANIGDPEANIIQAIGLLKPAVNSVVCAPLYTSKAVGYTQQPDFINTVVSGQTGLSALELLSFIQELERRVGRKQRFRWGPREIDIDIIFYGAHTLNTPELVLPHPRFTERDFVLQPLCDLNPSLRDPVSKLAVQTLLERLPESSLSITGQLHG